MRKFDASNKQVERRKKNKNRNINSLGSDLWSELNIGPREKLTFPSFVMRNCVYTIETNIEKVFFREKKKKIDASPQNTNRQLIIQTKHTKRRQLVMSFFLFLCCRLCQSYLFLLGNCNSFSLEN